MRALILALALLFPMLASAQTLPPDVPAYVPITATYNADGSQSRIGDGSTARGGVMPVLAKQLNDIPSTATGWLVPNVSVKDCASNLAGSECKSRFVANISHLAYDDPVRSYGQPGASHCHEFFGSVSTNAFSTYATLRNRANQAAAAGKVASTFAGGPYNATGYWFPCVIVSNAFGDGKTYAVKPFQMIVYYTENPGTGTLYTQRLPRGLRYVFGTNMDDPDDCGVKNEISLANGGSGTGCTGTGPNNRYAYYGNGFNNGSADTNGWQCLDTTKTLVRTAAGTKYSPSIKNLDGSDPWGGACLSGYYLVAGAAAPPCYDGNNLAAPGGYKHFRQNVVVVGQGRGDCPVGWFRVPALQITFYFKHQGFTDYSRWRLDSDDMAATVSGHPVANGASFHTDWMGGWDDTVFYGSADGSVQGWQKFCTGVDNATPHECDSSTINATQHLQGGYVNEPAPDGSRQPQVNQSPDQYSTTTPAGMFQVPANRGAGPATINAVPKQ